MIDDDSKVSEGLNAIPNESRVLDDPQVFQKESQLDVRTLIIPKSTVMPTSSMVLFTLRRVLGLLAEESYHFFANDSFVLRSLWGVETYRTSKEGRYAFLQFWGLRSTNTAKKLKKSKK